MKKQQSGILQELHLAFRAQSLRNHTSNHYLFDGHYFPGAFYCGLKHDPKGPVANDPLGVVANGLPRVIGAAAAVEQCAEEQARKRQQRGWRRKINQRRGTSNNQSHSHEERETGTLHPRVSIARNPILSIANVIFLHAHTNTHHHNSSRHTWSL